MRFTLKKQKITTATPSSSPTPAPSSSSSFSPSSLQQTMVGGRIIRAMLLSIKIVFNSWTYIAVAGAVAAIFWIIFNIFDQLLFFSPVFVFYLPQDAFIGFILSNITVILLGIVVSMNIFVLKHSDRSRISLTSFFSGSTISVLSSTCASCSSLGFLLVSTFGGVGVTASTILSNYQIPLRIVSIALLIWAFYSICSKLTKSCSIDYKTDNNKKKV
ncbi:MAG: hypothetical protein WCF06_03835 [Nitrososphaeraceae archaeon]